jgi:opacity protein-like surface antigen
MKLRSSIATIIALSSMSFAGGDINGITTFENNDYVAAEAEAAAEVVVAQPEAPEPKVVTPPATEKKALVTPKPVPTPVSAGNFYVGGAVAAMAARSNCEGDRANVFAEEEGQDRQVGITGILGYDFMDYLGAELRASMGVSGEDDGAEKIQQYGIYLKPNYDITDAINLYGLLGYSSVNMSDCFLLANSDPDNTNSGFSYGAGLDYGVTENISVFTDIVNYLRDDDKASTWGTNIGLKYNF